MSNPFFTRTFDVAPGSTNRSQPVENEFAAINTGFNSVYAYLLRGVFAPSGETLAPLQARATRKNKVFQWDNNGDPGTATFASSEQMDAAVAAANAAAASEAIATAAANSVANANSYIQQLMLAQGVK